jgi:hypothetical protein
MGREGEDLNAYQAAHEGSLSDGPKQYAPRYWRVWKDELC